ncbi:MAG: thioredoxin reductase (NADPH), partial [Saprospiraceae bacterium]
ENKIKVLLNSTLKEVQGKDMLENVTVLNTKTHHVEKIDVDYLMPLFGLSPKLGPIADWGLNIDRNAIEVNIEDYSTNVPGIYAIGDINNYQNKLKLILCGFHEAAIMAHSAYKYLHPGVKYTMKYTTVSGVNTF